jgi:hypothetical protein
MYYYYNYYYYRCAQRFIIESHNIAYSQVFFGDNFHLQHVGQLLSPTSEILAYSSTVIAWKYVLVLRSVTFWQNTVGEGEGVGVWRTLDRKLCVSNNFMRS